MEDDNFLKTMSSRCIKTLFSFLLCLLFFPIQAWPGNLSWQDEVKSLAGGGAVLVTDSHNRRLVELNPDKPLIPASILKIFTAAAALNYLGPSYHFTTEFRLGPDNDLYVVGKGDPFLISEELAQISRQLKIKGINTVKNIFLDDTYFKSGLVLHGTNRSINPYDAFNCALCVNFNTIFVRIGTDGKVYSAEPQTPLTHFARQIALRSGLKGKVRINLAESPEKCLLYTGELLKTFLTKSSIQVHGSVSRATKDSKTFPLFYLHRSQRELTRILREMFKYSNNFIANQIFLAMGASRYGPPATEEKSRRVMAGFLTGLGLPHLNIEEGSGLSRRTLITAAQMIRVLDHFTPYRSLLTHKGHVWIKTGSLNDVKSVAGYLVPDHSSPFSFVIILNGRRFDHRTRDQILSLIEKNL